MSNRPLAIASLLMIAAALSADPAVAVSTGALPNTGPPPDVTIPDAGVTILGDPTGVPPSPQPPPAPPAESTPPGIAELLRAYSTVTISPGGTTSVTAPSAALRAVIEEEYAAGRI